MRRIASTDEGTGLYRQIGGEKLWQLVREFYQRMFSDPILCFLFVGRDRHRFARSEWEFTARRLGAPITYSGRSLSAAHRNSLILEGHFYRRLMLLDQVLHHHGAPIAIRKEWLRQNLELQPVIKLSIDRTALPGRYGLFIGSPEQRQNWRRDGLDDVLMRIEDWIWRQDQQAHANSDEALERYVRHRIWQITTNLLEFQFDQAVSVVVHLTRDVAFLSAPLGRDAVRALVVALTGVAPRMTEILWELIGGPALVYIQPYPNPYVPLDRYEPTEAWSVALE